MAVGYFARKNDLAFTIYEGSNRVGGNCVTFRHEEFLFDSGAHRLHDKFEDVTSEIKGLMGEDLRKIYAPSQIYEHKTFIDFPLSPLNLLRKLGISDCAKAGFALVRSRLKGKPDNNNFENFALHTYGKILAERFLLNYSEKLWGAPCKGLSPGISGSRMKGLGLKTFLIEAILGSQAKAEHLDGSFYYPKMGYGTIAEELAKFCGADNVRRSTKITKIFHDHNHVRAIEINGEEIREVETLVSTLPLNLFISMMDPPAPEEIACLSRSLRFRNLILAGFFINRPLITANASIYFPEAEYPFTRIYEPKNRSEYMSPADKTSLIAEIPCNANDDLWKSEDGKLIQFVSQKMERIFDIRNTEILSTKIIRLHNAYPILEIGFEEKVAKLTGYLQEFPNLKITGRSGMFAYTHLHDMMKLGKELVAEYLADPSIYAYATSNTAVGN